ncbi:MAG TPA: hypothetical protein VGM83_01460 [Devosiaceae bacterium]|jgi:hypothetical protein
MINILSQIASLAAALCGVGLPVINIRLDSFNGLTVQPILEAEEMWVEKARSQELDEKFIQNRSPFPKKPNVSSHN